MNLDQILNLEAILFGGLGSIFVLRSIMGISPKMIYELASTKWDFNPELIDSISNQKAEALVGTLIIIFALLISIINSIFSFDIFHLPNKAIVVITGLCFIVLVYFASSCLCKKIFLDNRRRTAKFIALNQIQEYLKFVEFPCSGIESLRYLNAHFFNGIISSSDPDIFLKDFGAFLGISIRSKVKIAQK